MRDLSRSAALHEAIAHDIARDGQAVAEAIDAQLGADPGSQTASMLLFTSIASGPESKRGLTREQAIQCLIGQIPDVIEDEWIEDRQTFDRECDRYIRNRSAANAFDLRWGGAAAGTGSSAAERAWQDGWETCAKVISRRDVVERMNDGW